MHCVVKSPTIPSCGIRDLVPTVGLIQSIGDTVSLRQQLLNLLIRLFVGAFAEVHVTDKAVNVDQIPRRPETLAVRVLDGVVVVQDDRVLDVRLPDGFPNVGDVSFEAKLR